MPASISKPLLSFKNKLSHFDDDIEFVDILYSTVKGTTIDGSKLRLFEYQDQEKHPNISRYSICQDNRLLIMRHLKSTIYSSYVKDVYEEVTIYLHSIISEAYQNASVTPSRIIGEHKMSLSTVEILTGIQNGTLAQTVIDNTFQALENERSTISLIKKTCKKLGINVQSQLINDAVYYLEIRHKLVHTDGYADEKFRKSHPTLKYTNGNYIDLTYQIIQSARTAIFTLMETIDADAIAKAIIKPNTSPTPTHLEG